MKKPIKMSWDGVGELEISVYANQEATLRYTPSQQFVSETLAQFAKTSGKPCNSDLGINYYPEIKGAENPAKQPTNGYSMENFKDDG